MSPPTVALEERLHTVLEGIKARQESAYSVLKLVLDLQSASCCLTIHEAISKTDLLSTAFPEVKALIHESEPCLLLVRIDIRSNSSKWALIPWVPAGTDPEQKQLYAVARAQIGAMVGKPDVFVEYFITDKDQINFDTINAFMHRSLAGRNDYTALEGQLQFMQFFRNPLAFEERPPVTSLKFSNSLLVALGKFKEKKENFVCISLDDATAVATVESSSFIKLSLLASLIRLDEPRYYLISHTDKIVLLLFSPESAKKVPLLLYTACKCSMISLLQCEGFNVWKSVDSQNQTDINESLFQSEFDTKGDLLTKVHPRPVPPGSRYSKISFTSVISTLGSPSS